MDVLYQNMLCSKEMLLRRECCINIQKEKNNNGLSQKIYEVRKEKHSKNYLRHAFKESFVAQPLWFNILNLLNIKQYK